MDGDGQREAILSSLRGAHELDTNELAERLRLHPNTVRWHLGRLADDGLVAFAPRRTGQRGRPSVAFRLTGDGMAHDRDEYRLLATMLMAVVATDPHGDARAYETGRRWGRDLHAAEPATSVVQLLDLQGFSAEQRGERIEMRRCPFAALAESCPQVVCTLHRGIIDGALAHAGSAQSVDRLDPFVEPGLCVAHLA